MSHRYLMNIIILIIILLTLLIILIFAMLIIARWGRDSFGHFLRKLGEVLQKLI